MQLEHPWRSFLKAYQIQLLHFRDSGVPYGTLRLRLTAPEVVQVLFSSCAVMTL